MFIYMQIFLIYIWLIFFLFMSINLMTKWMFCFVLKVNTFLGSLWKRVRKIEIENREKTFNHPRWDFFRIFLDRRSAGVPIRTRWFNSSYRRFAENTNATARPKVERINYSLTIFSAIAQRTSRRTCKNVPGSTTVAVAGALFY